MTARRYSAVVPNYNDGSKISESLNSLVAQKHAFDEIIIVDDASTDNSVEVIEALIQDIPNARLVRSEQNAGVVGALNRGLQMASGDYVFLCSANDTYNENMVVWAEEMLNEYPQAGIVSGNVGAFDQQTQRATWSMKLPLPQVRRYYTPEEFVEQNRKVGVHFNGGANALKLSLVKEFGYMRNDLRWHSDWFLNLMCAFRTGVAYVPEDMLTCRLEGTKSYSSGRFDWNREGKVLEHSLRMIREFPAEAEKFKQSALMAKYDMRNFGLLMRPENRWFITPLLVWRIIAFSNTYWLKRCVPRPVLMFLRRFARI